MAARQKIHDQVEVFVSAASSWEVAINVGIGKLEVPEPVSVALPKHGFLELPISVGHSEAAGALPLHHRDPFDRMLVAQARTEREARAPDRRREDPALRRDLPLGVTGNPPRSCTTSWLPDDLGHATIGEYDRVP